MKYVFSVGGSIINPGKIDISFLKKFKKIISSRKKDSFVIVCGGGKPAREYINALEKFGRYDESSKDLLGMSATWVNARLINLLFKDLSPSQMPSSVEMLVDQSRQFRVVTCGGFFPGLKTDDDSAVIAELVGADYVINLTDVDYVYDKDPKKYRDAMPFRRISYKKYLDIVSRISVGAGSSAPFNLYAALICQRSKIKIIIASKDLDNLRNILNRKSFKGTVIS